MSEFLRDCAAFSESRLQNYGLFQGYYDGEQRTYMTDRIRRYLQRSGMQFAENFCEVIVDTFAERLALTGFLLEDDAGRDLTDLQTMVASWLQRNRLDGVQGVLYLNTLIKGDGYLIVDFDPVRRIPRLVYNQPEHITPHYSPDEPGTLDLIVKKWDSRARGPQNGAGAAIQRMNLYYPDRVEKYFTTASDETGDWAEWLDASDDVWPTPWVADGVPLGIPVFHFRHKHLDAGMGRSELKGMLPQQDLLNKQVIDMADIMDYLAWPQRWIAGAVKDAVTLQTAPGEYLFIPDATASAGQFDAADISQVNEAIEATLARIGRRSRTPMHLLTGGTPPSGEALKTAESGLIAKVVAAQTTFGQPWEDACLLMLRLARWQGVISDDLETVVAQAQWRNPETRDEKADAERAGLLELLGVSKETLLGELGYDAAQEEEQRNREGGALGAAAASAFDRGIVPGA